MDGIRSGNSIYGNNSYVLNRGQLATVTIPMPLDQVVLSGDQTVSSNLMNRQQFLQASKSPQSEQQEKKVTVQPGDTFFGLLLKQGFSAKQIKDNNLVALAAQQNNLQNPNMIQPGQTFQLPDPSSLPQEQQQPTPLADGQQQQQQPQQTAPTDRKKSPQTRRPNGPTKKTVQNPSDARRKKAYNSVWGDMKGANDRKHFNITTRDLGNGNVQVAVKNTNPNDARNGNVDYYTVKNGKKTLVGSDTKEGCKVY